MSVEQRCQTLVEVFIAHRAQLRSLARKVVGTADLADEVVQDAYVRLAERESVKTDVERPFCYCCQVVRNVALDHCRRRSLEAKLQVQTEDGQIPEIPINCVMGERVDGWRLIQAIDQVLNTLPPRTRQAFELFRLGELTQREIAARLGCSATLVNFMVRDARQALESLKGHRELFAARSMSKPACTQTCSSYHR
ncbi:sigma-70 family RNA polymerase sigma factor [Azohydromonas lata]|uniref:sigma-70 family RNA polymerase sigma factor n=1 Tax=Azohydromonas lata TaxID=45677 RepID=UPI0009FCB587|nr:sigma-70 family RNA polymerase sigma factor [Azohydromonas lata]